MVLMKRLTWLIIIVIVLAVGWYLGSPLFIDKEVSEEFPDATTMPTSEELADMTPAQLEEIREEIMKDASEMPDKVMVENIPSANEPRVLKSGAFRGADSFHTGMGAAKIYELSDGSRVLRFENFDVVNGPDLRVLLSENENPASSDELGKYTELAKLKGNKGNQNYELPDNYDIGNAGSVVIYCKPFHVVFSVASLK
jgi:hypothetical protein